MVALDLRYRLAVRKGEHAQAVFNLHRLLPIAERCYGEASREVLILQEALVVSHAALDETSEADEARRRVIDIKASLGQAMRSHASSPNLRSMDEGMTPLRVHASKSRSNLVQVDVSPLKM